MTMPSSGLACMAFPYLHMHPRIRRIARHFMPRSQEVRLRYLVRLFSRTVDPELIVLRSLAEPRRIVVDVGANYGLYSYGLLGNGRTVEAFEPVPAVCAALAAFGSRLHAHCVALSDHAGEATLYVPYIRETLEPGNSSMTQSYDRNETMVVPLRTLDSFDFRGVTVLKVDVEGQELAVLRGAEATIMRERPILCVEIEQRLLGVTGVESVRRLIHEYGYDGWFINIDGGLKTIEEFSAGSHQLIDRIVLPGRLYINNFLFIHRRDDRRHWLEQAVARGRLQ